MYNKGPFFFCISFHRAKQNEIACMRMGSIGNVDSQNEIYSIHSLNQTILFRAKQNELAGKRVGSMEMSIHKMKFIQRFFFIIY